MHAYRTHNCGALRAAHVGQNVRLSGWVHRKRDHGGLLFVDLRDHYGITQIVLLPTDPQFSVVERLRVESVITITGDVVKREAETVNAGLATGEIEVRAREVSVQSEAEELPLPVFGEPDYPEETRLKYRFLDLRRETLHANIILRSRVIAKLRELMVGQGFTEYQTPILTASSPEGARDFLVPSRVHPGKFYALPQAPQQFKQLLMVAGFDRYFQIAPCFRDEDARADRSPGEFYQLDVEMSFVGQDDVFAAIEPVMHGVFETFKGERLVTPAPFPRIPYAQSMLKYGSDKPDLRIPIECSDISDLALREDVTLGVFKKIAESGGIVRAIPAPNTGDLARSFFDKMDDWAKKDMQAPGLAYIRFTEEGGTLTATGPIAKFFGQEALLALAARTGVKAGDGLFFVAGKKAEAERLQGAARNRIGAELGMIDPNIFKFCWIVDFPMYEWDEDNKKIDFSHNPFSMPQGGLDALLAAEGDTEKLLDLKAYQYDIVCNGVELSSGAIRNHRPEIMLKAFEVAGYGASVVEEKFGGMLNAFRYGAPPHGGIAPGVDRIVMLLAGVENIREVTLFPMNQQAQDVMMQAPSRVEDKQLKELHIRVVEPVRDKI
jgi:aspartyl-tRNA synthetase